MNFVIRKTNGKWVMESKADGNLERSEHTSRIKALNSFFCKHPRIEQFFIILPETNAEIANENN